MLSPSVMSTAVTFALLFCWYEVTLPALGSETWSLSCMNDTWCSEMLLMVTIILIFKLIER